jgi:hypothetical protein
MPAPKLIKYLPWVEIFFLLVLTVGITFRYFEIDPNGLVRTSLGGLAIIFFLYAYQPSVIEVPTDEKQGFSSLLSFSILPKVIWLCSSISVIGILFYYRHLSNGYKEILIIGSTSIAGSLFFQCIPYLNGIRNPKLIPILYRALPILLIDIYILINS